MFNIEFQIRLRPFGILDRVVAQFSKAVVLPVPCYIAWQNSILHEVFNTISWYSETMYLHDVLFVYAFGRNIRLGSKLM